VISNESIEVRQYIAATDKAFVYSTWLRNYKHSSYFAKRIKPHVFFKGHQAVIDHLLNKNSCKVFIASPKNDSETILGYLACEPSLSVVHFTFVKEAFRNMGIAKALFKEAGVDTSKIILTHWTYPVDDFMHKYTEMVFNPYAL
jgi:hypothetical protein